MHAILYDIFLIFLANVCRYCQAVLTAWIHSCILSFRSVDMYRVCHIHLWKIYHAGIAISNIILSKGRLISPTFNKTTYTFDETTFSEIQTPLYCRRHSKPILFFHKPQPVHVMQNTTTMSGKCREAQYP